MLQLDNVQSAWPWLLGIVAAAVLLFFVYYSIFVRTERRLTWVLLGLRGAGILALLLALARPVWTEDTTLVDPGRLAVVLDDSRSMSLAHTGGKSRYQLAREAVDRLQRQVEEAEGARVQVELFGIDGEPIDGEPADKPLATVTDLVRAVGRVESRLRSRELIGVVLVTDGMDNSGRGSILQLADSETPIHAIGFPSDPSSAELDLAVRPPQAPEQVLVNNTVTVRVPVVRAAGPGDQRVEVKVTVGGDRVEAEQQVVLEPGANQVEAVLTFEPTVAGRFMYRVEAEASGGERVLGNNVEQFALQVNAEAIGVLYLEGFLRYEYTFLRKRLDDDPDINLITVVRTANPQRPNPEASKVLLTPSQLDTVDLVILGDMEADFLGTTEYEALIAWAGQEGHAILVLGGYRSFGPNGFAGTPLADVLPVEFTEEGAADQADEPFTMALTAAGQVHPIFQVQSDRVRNKTLWDQAAQLAGCSLVRRAKPGATVLATNPITSVDDKPAVVVAVQNFGQGKSMVVTTDTTWRWSRVARLKGQGDLLFARFWSQSVRWLTGRGLDDQQAPLVVTTDRPGYGDGDAVSVRIVARDSAAAATHALAATITNAAGRRRSVPLRPATDGSGDQVATVYPDGPGRHVIVARSTREGETVANANVQLLVHGADLETNDTRTDSQVLRQIAAERGAGFYVDIGEAQTLGDKLQPDRRQRTITRARDAREYWNSPVLFFFFLAAVTGEWWIRRRNRLV
ncbi:MAG: glutamine amidotransferase [Planctomycetota bacterium]|nr:glutamine amidotransferase [Planctomycetota bacterium]